MFCPYCNNLCEAHDRFCSHCGTPLLPPAPKQGRHWVPIVIMVMLCAFGIGLFFALPGSPNTPTSVSVPESETPWFSISGGTLSFHKGLYHGDSKLVVPETVNGEAVLGLSAGCFEGCDQLTEIILPESLESIGADAFKECTALRGIYIPDSVIWIGSEAFAGCTALEAVRLNRSVESIGAGAFSGCYKLYYIYYNGFYKVWAELYPEYINPYTGIFCEDGSYYQGGNPY